jgi:hypothetical protein
MNTMVLMPGPSWTEYFWTLNTVPVAFLSMIELIAFPFSSLGRV